MEIFLEIDFTEKICHQKGDLFLLQIFFKCGNFHVKNYWFECNVKLDVYFHETDFTEKIFF